VRAGGGTGLVPRISIADWEGRFGVVAGVTTRGAAGDEADFDLRRYAASPEVRRRWAALAEELGFEGIAASRQVHGTEVRWHNEAQGVSVITGVDGHATGRPGILLAVTLADCIPIYLVDPVARAVALLHSGWRGSAADMLGAGLAILRARAGSAVENVVVHCGVGICGDCYEVGSEVLEACGAPVVHGVSGHLDLRSVIRQQAEAAGVAEISTSPRCSAHENVTFFSHRGSRGADGRMVAYLGIPAA
jgi:purine-nucleoside/S-methyl-5'-thioadenosine phosphorylase / adenosine deaminase